MRALALIAALLTGLLCLERSIAPTTAKAETKHRPLVSPEERAELKLTGFSLTNAGERFEYRRSEGVWRCVSTFGAVGDPRLITDLTHALLTRTAAWRAPSSAPQSMSAFELDAPLKVEFFREEGAGPPLIFHLGARVNSAFGASLFVIREGVEGIWELDSADLDAWLSHKDSGLPPLLDQRLTAGCPLDPSRGVARAFIDFEAGASLELRAESSEDEVRWILSDGSGRLEVLPYRLAGWLAFLQRAPYVGFANPQTAPERGLTPPAARVTLFPRGAPAIELILGRELQGKRYLLNKTSGMLLLLPQGWSELVAPTTRTLTVAEGENPWENWLR